MPEFSATNELRLQGARHPGLEDKLRKENRSIVPMTLTLGGEERVLVISGPNTGGKTVVLKTTGIAALSAQSGIPVAAERAVLPLFDGVLVDIGDEQSIAADLSTFSAHMLNLKTMLQAATANSLVLADEMGTGTAPEEGAALAVALLDEFRARSWTKSARSCELSGSKGSTSALRSWNRSLRRCTSALTRILRASSKR